MISLGDVWQNQAFWEMPLNVLSQGVSSQAISQWCHLSSMSCKLLPGSLEWLKHIPTSTLQTVPEWDSKARIAWDGFSWHNLEAFTFWRESLASKKKTVGQSIYKYSYFSFKGFFIPIRLELFRWTLFFYKYNLSYLLSLLGHPGLLFDYKRVTEYWSPNPGPVYMVAYVKFLSYWLGIISNTDLFDFLWFFLFHSVAQTKQHFFIWQLLQI